MSSRDWRSSHRSIYYQWNKKNLTWGRTELRALRTLGKHCTTEVLLFSVIIRVKNRLSHERWACFLLSVGLWWEASEVPLLSSMFLFLVTKKNIFQNLCVPNPVGTGKVENSERKEWKQISRSLIFHKFWDQIKKITPEYSYITCFTASPMRTGMIRSSKIPSNTNKSTNMQYKDPKRKNSKQTHIFFWVSTSKKNELRIINRYLKQFLNPNFCCL